MRRSHTGQSPAAAAPSRCVTDNCSHSYLQSRTQVTASEISAAMGALLKLAVIGVLLAALGERLVKFSRRVQFFREIDPLELPNCQFIKGIEYGSEDIALLPNGLAFISSGLKFPGIVSFAPEKPGEIFLLDLNDEELRPSTLRISKGFDLSTFSPHGISAYIDEEDDSVYLFVVNHPHYKSTVEIFKFAEEENVLVHLKTIKHSALHNVNDIVAVGPESFYATNDFYFSDFIMRLIEMVFGLRLTNVVYYSPGEVREVAAGFYNADGIAMSADQKYIYVADLTGRTFNVFEKHANWSLSPVKVVELETLLDNLSVDPVTEDIWIGGHPNLKKVFRYDPKDLPGSEIVRIQNILSDKPIVTTVYANDGSVIQASACAAVYGNKLFIGTIFHKALCCQL
ncbi:serum paraoxonase/arylesterase 2-like isoform X1 [Ranitomeya imitator]|uniref:serum paraoxonase/arylesterase 2-like isoform X1 n=1 Tax=Ranitomeya imitator TaxID=111125 RepID=UPI0037E7D201